MTHGLVHEMKHDSEQFTGEIGEIHCAKSPSKRQVSHSRDDSDPFWTILRSSQLQHLTIKKRTLSDVTYVLESMDPLFERLFSSSMTIYSSKDEQKSRFRLKVPSRRDTLTQKQSKIHMNS